MRGEDDVYLEVLTIFETVKDFLYSESGLKLKIGSEEIKIREDNLLGVHNNSYKYRPILWTKLHIA